MIQAFLVLAEMRSENAASAICMSDFPNFRLDRFALRWIGYSRVITTVSLVWASLLSIGCFAVQKRGERDLHF